MQDGLAVRSEQRPRPSRHHRRPVHPHGQLHGLSVPVVQNTLLRDGIRVNRLGVLLLLQVEIRRRRLLRFRKHYVTSVILFAVT